MGDQAANSEVWTSSSSSRRLAKKVLLSDCGTFISHGTSAFDMNCKSDARKIPSHYLSSSPEKLMGNYQQRRGLWMLSLKFLSSTESAIMISLRRRLLRIYLLLRHRNQETGIIWIQRCISEELRALNLPNFHLACTRASCGLWTRNGTVRIK